MNQCYNSEEYNSLMNYVFDDEMDGWFERNIGDMPKWQENVDLVQKYQDLANSKKDEWQTLKKYWLTAEEEDKYSQLPHWGTDSVTDFWINFQIEKHRLNNEAAEILKRAVKKKLTAKKAEIIPD